MNTEPLFTIFTATFNRKHLLPRAYESIRSQTFRDFEWLIIDDGSTDGTEELVKTWQSEASFPIIYKWKPNGGKHTAFNMIGEMARGKLVAPLDSDDEMVTEALERYKFHWDQLSPEEQDRVGCIICLSKHQDGNIAGDRFPEDKQIVDLMRMSIVKKIKGEKGGILNSKVFKMYPYPEHIRNVYIPEEVFQQKLSKNWKALCINEVLRIYWVDKRDDHDGERIFTKENYPGNQLLHLAYLNYTMRLFWNAPRLFFANAVYYVKLSFHLGQGLKAQYKNIHTFSGRLLWLTALPPGFLFYIKDRKAKIK
ncbi:MAG TPA: glycosyltransferase family 2 protein [Chitinophagaceae bacterium]|nr:glycosyltransferase family 2 protein [Chitinophagaceae bacterium]